MTSTLKRELAFLAAVVVLAMMVSAYFTWLLTKPKVVIETAAPAVVQADGSVIAEKAPDASAKPKQIIPKGARVERIFQVKAKGQGIKLPSGETKDCPPVTIDMSLVRQEDGSKRVLVSSPDGQISKSLDIPVENVTAPAEAKKWGAGILFNPVSQTGGVWIDRDIGRIRLGVQLNQTRASLTSPVSAELWIKAGMTF